MVLSDKKDFPLSGYTQNPAMPGSVCLLSRGTLRRPQLRSQGSEHLFFRHFTEQGCLGDLCILLVTHLLPDRPDFIQVLDGVGRVGAILPKPKSVHGPTLAWAQQHYPVLPLIPIRLKM